jgi:hypothetical protein
MITNEEAVRNQLEFINSNPVKRKEKLHDKNWDISLLDNNKLSKLTTQELAKKLVFAENQVNEFGAAHTVYKWHFDNSNYSDLGKQSAIVACQYWLRKKNTQLLGNI